MRGSKQHALYIASWGTLIAGLGIAFPARAQPASNGTQQLRSLDPAAQPATPAKKPQSGLEEVVVHAQKRSERLQDVPIAVTAITGTKLKAAGITDTMGLSQVTPGLNFGLAALFLEPDIRGVQSSVNSLGAESNVAVYVDGVYQASPTATILQLADVSQVEVLKGPQGTLFGRNATGGAISVTTRDPTFTPVAEVSASYGRYNEAIGSAFISGPMTDTLAGSLALYGKRDDGYYTDLNLHKNLAANRISNIHGKLQYKPTPDTKITVSADYGYTSNDAGVVYTVFDQVALTKGIDPNVLIPSKPYTSALSFPPTVALRNAGLTLNAEQDFDNVDLVSVTGYRRSLQDSFFDLDNTPLNYLDLRTGIQTTTFSEDLRLQSPSTWQRFIWTIGLYDYYSLEDYKTFDLTLPLFGLHSTQTGSSIAQAQAIYGQASYKITPKWSLTFGLRYNHERRGEDYGELGDLGVVPPASAYKTWYDLSPKVTLAYKFDPRSTVYFTYSKGYKSGLFNPGGLTSQTADPEKLYSYELGVKTDLTPNLRLNVSSFYYDYRDLQIQSFIGDSSQVEVNNASEATVYGSDGDIFTSFSNVLAPDDQVSLTTGFAFLHSSYGDYPGAVGYTINPDGIGQTIFEANAKGKHLIEAPTVTLNGDLGYRVTFGFGEIAFNANAYYNAGYYNDALNTLRIRQPSYVMANMSLDWISPNGRYDVALWGKNITSAKVFSTPVSSTTSIGANYTEPATYGIRLTYKI